MQEDDAERRIQILRGIKIDTLPAPNEESTPTAEAPAQRDGTGRERKRRRIAGEDDTDRDIRFAQENGALVPAKADLQLKSRKSSDAPITDGKGHINLFPVEGSRHHAPKNAEVEAEKAKKRKEYEDQYTMRFSNAAGFKQSIGDKPWYSALVTGGEKAAGEEVVGKDVWGNEDPRRKEREKSRMVADDPLAAIQKGVSGVRDVEKERQKWREEKKRETREIKEAERRREKIGRKRKNEAEDDMEGFSLDAPAINEQGAQHSHIREHKSSRRRHRHRSRSRDRDRQRLHHHHSAKLREDRSALPAWAIASDDRYTVERVKN